MELRYYLKSKNFIKENYINLGDWYSESEYEPSYGYVLYQGDNYLYIGSEYGNGQPDENPDLWLIEFNKIEINEPIGFDSVKTEIKRHEYHGVTVENSLTDLEFDGNAFLFIKQKYNDNIENLLYFDVKKDDNLETFAIDLPSYIEENSDHCSCRVRIGEIGAKTTFNNRIDTEVDVMSLKSIDNVDLTEYDRLEKSMFVKKEIRLTNIGECQIDGSTSVTNIAQNSSHSFLLGFNKNIVSEFGTFAESEPIYYTKNTHPDNINFTNLDEKDNNIFSKKLIIKYDLKTKAGRSDVDSAVIRAKMKLYAINNSSYLLSETEFSNIPLSSEIELNLVGETEFTPISSVHQTQILPILIIERLSDSGANETIYAFHLTGSFISVQYDNNTYGRTIKYAMLHEISSRISEIISGITVKSDFYSCFDSNINPILSGVGDGALKGISTQNNLLGQKTPLNISFEDYIKNINCIDNVGWGFSNENGIDYVRIEPINWFYNDNIILEINNPNKKTIEPLITEYYSRLNIGYSKYAEQKDLYASDTIHGKRGYVNSIKSIDNEADKVCSFIADPYLIIKTIIDKKLASNTDEAKYIFCLKQRKIDNILVLDSGFINDDDSVYEDDTWFNMRITPYRNSIRHKINLFSENILNSFVSITYTGNATCKSQIVDDSTNFYYLNDSANNASIYDNSIIEKINPFYKKNILSIEYPLSCSEVQYVKSNPYGIVKVDGEDYYIKEFIRTLIDNVCEFKLIPKF